MNSTTVKALKAIAAVVVLVVLLLTVRGYLSDYREAPRTPAAEPTQTAEPPADSADTEPAADAEEPAREETEVKELRVTIDGLNLRTKPDSTAEPVRGLKKDEVVTVVAKTGDWYEVTTEKDEKGFITDNPGYTKAVE